MIFSPRSEAGAGMPMKPWRATCIQMKSRIATKAADRASAWSIIQENLGRAAAMVEAACEGPDPPKVVVLPEFAFQGPPHGGTVPEWIEKGCYPIPGPITAPLAKLAIKYGIYTAANQFEFDETWPGRFFNCCFLIDPNGEIILRYRRINTASWPSPHDFMDAYIAHYGVAGTFPVVDTELGRLAMLPCGEIAVPEVARVFMMRGAEVILHPTNEEKSTAQEAAKIVRAAENMVYLISANVAGGTGFSADGSVLGGRSQIIDYRGKALAFDGGSHESTSVSALIDLEALRRARREIGMGNALLRGRWEMYRPFFTQMAAYPCNQFLHTPMADAALTRPVAEAALRNLMNAGVVQPQSERDKAAVAS
jgi:predicted amidohydrolase